VSGGLVVVVVSNPIAERVSGFVLIATLRGNVEIKYVRPSSSPHAEQEYVWEMPP
jgi:hypothetical protein